MEETSATATPMVATISRTEVEEAARNPEPVDLLLDVRVEQDGRADTQRLAVAWETADLERLLETTSGDEIQLAFDEEELRLLLDPDVEAHGLREKFAVVTAVAGLAAAAAGPPTPSVYRGSEGGTPAAAAQAVAPAEITTGLAPAAQTGTAAAPAAEISTGLGPAAGAPAQAAA